MDFESNRLFSAVRKYVNVSWGFAVVGMPIMALLFLLTTFVPGILPVPTRLTADLMFYGSNMTLTLPAGALEPDVVLKLPSMLYGLAVVEAPVILIGTYQLKKILENVAKKTPFIIENANRMRIVGLAIIGGAALTMVREFALGIYLMDRVHVPGFAVGTRPDLGQIGMIVVGLIVLLLAEVFRYGIALQEEHDLTV